jgi:metabolite-proton symporter
VLEWYDFSLYGSAAAIVFGRLFFPGFSPLAGTLAAFATYAVGFFARPFGGLVFGHLGDKIGRRTVLLLTVLIMGVATFLIGLLPTYSAIGIWAPILLLVLRVLQGFGGGAEQSGAVLLVTEYAPRERRGFYASLPFIGITFGILLAAGIFRLVTALPEDQFLAWGWRVPFLLSIIVVGIGLYIRLRVLETPVFEEVKEAQAEAEVPAVELFRNQPGNFFRAFGARFAENGGSYVFQVFVLTYVTQLGLSEGVGLTGVLLSAAVGMFTLPLFGALSDRVGRRPVYMGAAIFMALYAFPYFWLLDTRVPVLIWLAIILSYAVGTYGMLAPQSAFFPELFNARYRYSGVALARELSAPVAGGVAPFIATALLAWSGGESWPIALYLILLALITIVSVYLAPETRGKDLSEKIAEPPRTSTLV